MRAIHKYELHIEDGGYSVLYLKNPQILDVQYQGENAVVWLIEDETSSIQDSEAYTFVGWGTGWDVGPIASFEYLTTLQEPWDDYVWHIFWKQGAV